MRKGGNTHINIYDWEGEKATGAGGRRSAGYIGRRIEGEFSCFISRASSRLGARDEVIHFAK